MKSRLIFIFKIEYIFLNIRAKSIGEAIKVRVTCPDDGETEIPVTVYVDEIKVVKSKDHKTDIVLDDKSKILDQFYAEGELLLHSLQIRPILLSLMFSDQ